MAKLQNTRRFKLVMEILKQTKKYNTDMSAVYLMLMTLSDRALTKFHKEYIGEIKSKK